MTIDAKSSSKWDKFVLLFVRELSTRFPSVSFGTYPGHDPREGLAHDGMIPGGAVAGRAMTAAAKKLGDALADYAWKRRKDSGLWYQIWNRRIRSRTYESAGWRPYFNPVKSRRGTPSGDHTNHHHASHYAGKSYTPPADAPEGTPAPVMGDDAYMPPLPWTVYLDKLRPGVTDSRSVWVLQRALHIKPRTGAFTELELAEVAKYQRDELGDAQEFADGLLGPLQAAKLFGPLVKIEAKS